jgi:hypothetical protein
MLRTRAELIPHPQGPRPVPEIRIAASIERTATGVELRYEVAGELAGIAWPAPAQPRRADELWRHTCFEAFCASPGAGAYYEFNFSPSTSWAAYRFGGYRERLADPELAAEPLIASRAAGALRVTDVVLDTSRLPRLRASAPLEFALTAVIEGTDGRIHHYGLAHPGERADFHDRRGFLLTIPGYGATSA